MSATIEFTIPCICGSERFHRVPGLRFKTCEVVRCRECGQLRTFPEPASEENLAAIYDAATSEKYTLERDDHYREQYLGFAVRQIDLIERHHPQRGRMLDIGCDQAVTLCEARRRGWEVEGIEINAEVARVASERTGIGIHVQPIEELDLPDESFDAIVCNQVLEHVPHPPGMLQEIHRVLRPGGVALLGTPCFTAPIGTVILRHRWYALVPSEHIWQFGPWTLKRLIRRAGLEVAHYDRGCSAYWGRLEPRPKPLARWLLFRGIKVARQGDFLRYVARRPS